MSLATTLACPFSIPKADHVMTMKGILYLKFHFRTCICTHKLYIQTNDNSPESITWSAIRGYKLETCRGVKIQAYIKILVIISILDIEKRNVNDCSLCHRFVNTVREQNAVDHQYFNNTNKNTTTPAAFDNLFV